MTFGQAFDTVRRGLDVWRAKEHNAKWWARIDGTPIPNDLTVCIAQAVSARSAADVVRIVHLENALKKIAAADTYKGAASKSTKLGRAIDIARLALQ